MTATPGLPQLPPIDSEEYKWGQSETDPTLWQRRACGTEAIVGVESSNKNGENDMYYAATLEFQDKTRSLSDIQTAARRAWQILRLEHPEVACSAAHDGQVKCFIQYRAPKNDHEAQEWAERTIIVEASDRQPLTIRDDVLKARKAGEARSAEAATIYIASSVSDEKTPLGNMEVRFLFHTNHLFFDGIGLREMASAFFSHLAAQLSGDSTKSSESLDWENNAQNLSPAVVYLMDDKQEISGPGFDDALHGQLGTMMRGIVSNAAKYLCLEVMFLTTKLTRPQGGWGLSPSDRPIGIPQTLFHTFTALETANIISNIKRTLGPKYTITHLGQTAVLLALVKANPPTGHDVSDSVLYMAPSSINGRPFMAERISSGTERYFPVCQCNGAVLYENIKQYVQPKDKEDPVKTRELLKQGAKVAKEQYDTCLTRPNVLAIAIPTMEMFASMIFA